MNRFFPLVVFQFPTRGVGNKNCQAWNPLVTHEAYCNCEKTYQQRNFLAAVYHKTAIKSFSKLFNALRRKDLYRRLN